MKIHFNQVMPTPLSSIQHGPESIWGAQFTLDKGQRVLLNASSGKGKTTFTHTLAGIRQDYKGSLHFDDREIRSIKPEEWATLRKNQLSFVFQDLELFPSLTVQENLNVKNDLTQTFSASTLKEMLENLGIVDKWNVPCRLLSMGQQQRVAIIRALAQPFDWIILDEPFSHLDNKNTALSLQLIHERCDSLNAGFVLTTLGDLHGYTYQRELNL